MKLKSILFALFLVGFFTACEDDDHPSIDLPPAVQAYLDSNYPNHEVEEAELETLCTGEEAYEIELESSDDEEFEAVINSEGALLFTEHEISVNDLPADVSGSLASNYADYIVQEADRLDMADGSTRYEVEIKNGESQLDILTESDGTVVCEEEDSDDDEG